MVAGGYNKFRLDTGRVLLPEGRLDKRFFQKLIEIRGLDAFDMPWPWIEGEPLLDPAEKYIGRDSFGKMLEALDAYIGTRISAISGILITVDAQDDPDQTFQDVCNQIQAVRRKQKTEKFPLPSKPMQISHGTGGMPSIAVMLMPSSGRGSLETLCVDYLKSHKSKKYSSVHGNVDTFLTTRPTDVSAWSKERQDKAYLQCMLASTHEKNPAIHAQQSFSGQRPIIDLKDPFFDSVSDQIVNFCRQLP